MDKKIFRKSIISSIIIIFFITSIFNVSIKANNIDKGTREPKTIWGYVTYCNGSAAVGASVVVNASGFPDETTITDSVGAFQVDVGPDTGTEWPDGTSFTVFVTKDDWSGSNTDMVSGSVTRCDVTLNPPTLFADADANPTIVVVGETVNFYGSVTGGASPYSWHWNFSDGNFSYEKNPTHEFNSQGIYNCVLTVADDCDNMDTDDVIITVNPVLYCNAVGPYSGTICDCVQFDGFATGGHGGYSYSWDFDDSDGIQVDSTEEDPCVWYNSDSNYIATLTVTDSESDTVIDSTNVFVFTIPVIYDEYPVNNSIGVERPPTNISSTVEDIGGDNLDVHFQWRNHDNMWVTLQAFTDVGNGTYDYIPVGNDWIWGDTSYIWSVNVTDGFGWANQTFFYTTGGSRYDINNNDVVNFQDAGLCWIHRDTVVPYDGLYDVNLNGVVNFQDAGLCWINRD